MRRVLRAHPRLLALAVAAVLAFGALAVAAARSRTPGGCSLPPPVADVPAELRSIGGFDQPFPSDAATLRDTALRAAAALRPDLSTTRSGDPVTIGAAESSGHTAVVVPLLLDPGAAGGRAAVQGLVSFQLDCGGRASLGPVVDLTATPLADFPSVPRSAAAAALGDPVELVWRDSPAAPEWRRRGGTACLAATATAVPGCAGGSAPPSPG